MDKQRKVSSSWQQGWVLRLSQMGFRAVGESARRGNARLSLGTLTLGNKGALNSRWATCEEEFLSVVLLNTRISLNHFKKVTV